ncbi:VOC family protein [Nocardioides sp. B-3]|uniref:VOC family protein n=1 Tax=Nocardioides sp. B-3 TaxID=2895565 RepID=UPI002152F23E|nr:VOC family protein [Nocardioides sp. B-3]UUZ59897.1 VOC family protein [Nocardioides sp. B-3]
MTSINAFQTNLFCEDLDACTTFYECPGLRPVFRAPAEGPPEHVEVEAAGVRIGLTSAAAANRHVGLGVTTSASVATEIVLWVADVDGMHEAALAAGATEVVAPLDSPDDRLHFSWVRDPDGHRVKFVQKR